jgi:branched-chain amino acid transport system substrate-binding protein
MACGGTATTNTGEIPAGDITFGSLEAYSGALASSGPGVKTAEDIAVAAFNKTNNIAGHKVAVMHLDEKSDPAIAVAMARQLIDAKITGMFDPGAGAPHDQTLPLFNKAGIVVISTISTSNVLDVTQNPYYFTPNVSNDQVGKAAAAYAKRAGFDHLGTLSDSTTYGDTQAEAVKKYAKANGLTVDASIAYPTAAVDLTTQLRQLQAAGVQTLLATGFNGFPKIFAGLTQIGWAPHIIGNGTIGNLPAATLGSFAATTLYQCNGNQALPTGGSPPKAVKAVLDEYQATMGTDARYLPSTLTYFYALLIYKYAIEKVNSSAASKIKPAIEQLKDVELAWPGIKYTFTPTIHNGIPDSALRYCKVGDPGPNGLPYIGANG